MALRALIAQRVVDVNQWPAIECEFALYRDAVMLIQVNVDPEIFDTNSGSLYVWFDDLGVPGRGIVEDMIGLGDVRGYLD